MKHKGFCYFIFILSMAGFFNANAQKVLLNGTISDTVNKPLESANVLAIPISKNQQIKFSITDD